ncbi:MFS transporter [Desulfofustis glycolicus]|uniref:MFS transporter, UMF1 family n=1 Tax=Desulfofustis glycolicus DSM 9705 TaxID=1121409 RepID=A0A1M5X5G8_9BACT|nr:MFS transporter [Desulfofustis glycolicus]SHH95056.1 MFS transporter, UMF1 family [Desulfofustis glycolicus DSM 9705]
MSKPAISATPLTREERSWVLYDVANSAFVLVMITAIMPIYFKDIAARGMPAAESTAYWGFANAAASLILALLAPVLGALADSRGRKKAFFSSFLGAGLLLTVALAFVGSGHWLLCLTLFVLARVGWAGANIFYDSFLVDVTTLHRMDAVSSRGYAYGYIGSVIPFLIVIGLILSAGAAGDTLPAPQARVGFIVVALWWLIFSLPALRDLRQRHYEPIADPVVSSSFRRLLTTLRDIRKHRQAFVFLIAYFFFIDGVGTIISMSTAYGRDLGFGVTLLIAVLLVIQVVAFPFALLFGRLAARFGTKNTLLAGITVYCLITLLAFLLPFIADPAGKIALFWLIALLVASSMGGIQALSRSYFGRLIPPAKSAEFFGFYNIFGKFAAISGPLLMGLITRVTGDSRWGVLSILLLFAVGGWILSRIKED